ncbi:MAG: nitrogen regulation protein NR(II) [Pseudomonadota bacterium]
MKGDSSLSQCEQTVLGNLTAAVLLFDAQHRLAYINSAGEILLEISARQIRGQPMEALFDCFDEELIAHIAEAERSGSPFTEREAGFTVGGRELTVDCTVVPLAEDPRGLLVEIQQVDRQLRMSREERLIAQHKAARDLVRGLAHEIKNPLGGLRGAAQLLAAELPTTELREYTEVIIQEADRLQKLVDSMLGPRQRPSVAEINLHQVLERVRQLVQAEAGADLVIARDYDPSIPPVHGDPDQLIQAFLNIVGNAARAVGNRGHILLRSRIQRQFTIGNVRHRLVAQVEVMDDGPGIPEGLRERLFYPLVTGDEGGFGLGLSIAQSLLNRHRGLIECSSRPGETVFTVLIPLENDR